MALQGVDSEASQEVKASEQPTERPGFAERPSERLTERPRVQETSRNHEKSRFWWVFVGFRHGIMSHEGLGAAERAGLASRSRKWFRWTPT